MKVTENEIDDKTVEQEITFIFITMPDKSVWQVEAALIATSRATAIADRDWGKVRTEDWQKTFNYAYSCAIHNSYVLWLYAEHYIMWLDLAATMIVPPIVAPTNYGLWYTTTLASWTYE